MVLLSVSGVTVEYGTDVVLNNINFSINEGDRLGIVGVNGAGKSTTIRLCLGLIAPTSGSVRIFGKEVREDPTGILRKRLYSKG